MAKLQLRYSLRNWKRRCSGRTKEHESKEMKPIIEEGDLPDIAIELLTQGNKKVDSPKLKKINPLDVLD